MIRMVRTTGTFEPEFKVYDARGIEVCGNYGAPVTGRTCQLADNASYTLLAFESFSRLNTGNYTLYLQRLNNPGSAQPINFGQTLAGTIVAGGEFDTYTFTATANDRVMIRMVRTTGTFEPEFKVYDARGIEVCGNYGAPVTGKTCQLAYNGSYTLLAFESFSRTNTGSYTLYLQRLNNPGNALLIGFGQSLSGAIDPGGEFDTYTFSGAVNDRVLLKMTRTSGTLEPEIKVYDPHGNEVCGNYGAPIAQISNCQLAFDGNYTILAFESFSRTRTGSYTLYLECLESPCGSTGASTLDLLAFIGGGYTLQQNCYELLVIVRNNTNQRINKEITLSESAIYRKKDGSTTSLPSGRKDVLTDCDNNTTLTTGGSISKSATVPAKGTATYRFRLKHDWEWIERKTIAKEAFQLISLKLAETIGAQTIYKTYVDILANAADLSLFLDDVQDIMNAIPVAQYTYTLTTPGLSPSSAQTVEVEIDPWRQGYLEGSLTAGIEAQISCIFAKSILVAPGCVFAYTTSVGLYFAAYGSAPLFLAQTANVNAVDYTELIEPQPIVVPELGSISDPNQRMFAQAYLEALSFHKAEMGSLERAIAARQAKDVFWTATQFERVHVFHTRQQATLNSISRIGTIFLPTLPPLTSAEAQQLKGKKEDNQSHVVVLRSFPKIPEVTPRNSETAQDGGFSAASFVDWEFNRNLASDRPESHQSQFPVVENFHCCLVKS